MELKYLPPRAAVRMTQEIYVHVSGSYKTILCINCTHNILRDDLPLIDSGQRQERGVAKLRRVWESSSCHCSIVSGLPAGRNGPDPMETVWGEVSWYQTTALNQCLIIMTTQQLRFTDCYLLFILHTEQI